MKAMERIRGAVLAWRLRLHGHKVGRGLGSRMWNPFLGSLSSKRRIRIGDGVWLGKNLSFKVGRGAELAIGDGCFFTGDAYVRAARSIRFGDHVLVAEHVSVRDANHGTAAGRFIDGQEAEQGTVEIGRDVWLGAGCRILKDAKIPDGCVLGANSVVLGSSRLERNGIYGGVPVRLLKRRGQG
jgi:acetyltransferase-like isoleucine patch superfamily enzyme